jgi:hypothetical protein
MHPMSRLGSGDHPPRRIRRKVLELPLVATCLTPLSVAAADEPAPFDAVTGPVAAPNAGLLAEVKAGRTVPFATRHAQLAPLIEPVSDLPFIASGTPR